MDERIFGLNAVRTLRVFASEAAVIAHVTGLEIYEDGWQFFSADGAALEPHYSIKPWIDIDRGLMERGSYTLRLGLGPNLVATLLELCPNDAGPLFLWSREMLEQYYEQPAPLD